MGAQQLPKGSKYPSRSNLPKTQIAIPAVDTLHNSGLGTLGLRAFCEVLVARASESMQAYPSHEQKDSIHKTRGLSSLT